MKNIVWLVIELLVVVVAAIPFVAGAVTNNVDITVTISDNSRPFTPLHTYFMAATGCNDANPGTSAAAPWCNPDNNGHVALVCGDVIVAAAGNYTAIGPSHSPGSCPSSSGGIDGSGQIYHAIILCGGADLEACKVTNGGGNAVGFDAVNNWAIEGFKVTNNGNNGRAFESRNCNTTGTASHHHAYINNVAYNTSQGFGMNDCGVQASKSVDYWAVVGNIAQNAAQDSICLGAIDNVGPGVFDTVAGTHYYMYGNFSYAHVNVGCRSLFDTEAYLLDTLDFHNVNTQNVVANNIGYGADRMGLQIFWQNNANNTPPIFVHHNTFFQNNTHTGGDNSDAEINVNNNGGSPAMPWPLTIQNNIAYQPLAISVGGGHVSAYVAYGPITTLTMGGSGNENVFKANNSSCIATNCNAGNDIGTFGPAGQLGTNTFANPGFNNTTDLLANQVGTPTCTGFINVTACAGYNANTQSLTNPSIIYDLTPTAVGTAGKGYQVPSTTCNTNAEFPVWLKGIVYLHWTGSSIVQNFDLVTLPCGL